MSNINLKSKRIVNGFFLCIETALKDTRKLHIDRHMFVKDSDESDDEF